jgi:uncharacterized protein with NAD-binding domain and iron-sulfur cluster
MTVKKVAILGGGVSALTTALELSAEADWQERYEITVYQMGWRLGGKGASSRNEAANGRIEEHGLHIWLGFYENAFAVIRRCYEELGRPAGTPLATWTDAFKPHSYISSKSRSAVGGRTGGGSCRRTSARRATAATSPPSGTSSSWR